MQDTSRQSKIDYSKWVEYNGLPPGQEDDLFALFNYEIERENIDTYEQAEVHFRPGSDSFTYFIIALEEGSSWFDYSQIQQVLNEINLYLEQLKYS